MKYTYAVDNGSSITFKDGEPYDGWYIEKYKAFSTYFEKADKKVLYYLEENAPEGFKYTSKVNMDGIDYDLYSENLDDLMNILYDLGEFDEEEKVVSKKEQEQETEKPKKKTITSATSKFYKWLKSVSNLKIKCIPKEWKEKIFHPDVEESEAIQSWSDIWFWCLKAVSLGAVFERRKLSGDIYYSPKKGIMGKNIFCKG